MGLFGLWEWHHPAGAAAVLLLVMVVVVPLLLLPTQPPLVITCHPYRCCSNCNPTPLPIPSNHPPSPTNKQGRGRGALSMLLKEQAKSGVSPFFPFESGSGVRMSAKVKGKADTEVSA